MIVTDIESLLPIKKFISIGLVSESKTKSATINQELYLKAIFTKIQLSQNM